MRIIAGEVRLEDVELSTGVLENVDAAVPEPQNRDRADREPGEVIVDDLEEVLAPMAAVGAKVVLRAGIAIGGDRGLADDDYAPVDGLVDEGAKQGRVAARLGGIVSE